MAQGWAERGAWTGVFVCGIGSSVAAAACRVSGLPCAVLVPFVPIILERMLFGTSVIFNGIDRHLQFAALPSFVGDLDARIFQELPSLTDQLSLFLTTDLWLGVIVGAALLYATVYFRHRCNEI